MPDAQNTRRGADKDLVVEAIGVTAGYNGAVVIEDVNVRARSGELTAIVGPNGAGKSTFIKVLAGLVQPMAGSVRVLGNDVTGQSANQMARRGMSYVPQVGNVFPTLTVRENLEMGAYQLRHGVREKVSDLCDMFPDLRPALRREARTLSGGQRTMLAIARALMVDPSVLVLDEPTAGLAPRFVDTVWEQILQVMRLDVAIVIVEQNTRRTLAHADWAYVLVLGRNRLEGTGPELLNDPEVVQLYVGGTA